MSGFWVDEEPPLFRGNRRIWSAGKSRRTSALAHGIGQHDLDVVIGGARRGVAGDPDNGYGAGLAGASSVFTLEQLCAP